MEANKKEEKQNKRVAIAMLLTIGFVAILVMLGAVTTNMMHTEAMNQARSDINSMSNVSDDYRQGWNDCLADIDDYYSKAHNTTDALADNCI